MSENLETLECENELEDDEDMQLRRLIYERLGLEFGSLKSESGNDWVRARDEILAEQKQAQIAAQKQAEVKPQELSDDEILANNELANEPKILELISSKKLESAQITSLIKLGKKDINIAIVRYQKLSSDQILLMLPSATYIATKMLWQSEQSADVRDAIVAKMLKQPMIYKEILSELGNAKEVLQDKQQGEQNDA